MSKGWKRILLLPVLVPSVPGAVRFVCFWASWIRTGPGKLFVRIRILSSTDKKKLRKTVISSVLGLLYDFIFEE
jgi:hypothetical protein